MSKVYASEPPTSGRVIFDTSHGPLEIQLWCRECPQTTRYFLQLCLDGFYDDVLFHRILPNTLLQCGALRSPNNNNNNYSGDTKEQVAVNLEDRTSRTAWEKYRQMTQASVALERRQYELHSRLRFSHRGLVAMALPATTNNINRTSNGDGNDETILDDDMMIQQQTQFFITLEEATYLDGKHVVFGTVAGPTIFNALRMGRIEVDEITGQPLDVQEAPRIKSVKIVENPIHTQLVPQPTLPWRGNDVKEEGETNARKKKKKRRGKLDTNVLSFGDELMEEESIIVKNSTHPAKKKSKPSDFEKTSNDDDNNNSNSNHESGKKEVEKLASQRPEIKDNVPSVTKYISESKRSNHSDESERKEAAEPPDDQEAEKEHRHNKKRISAIEARRAKYTANNNNRGKKKDRRQDDTLAKLMAFQGRVKETVVAAKTGSDFHTGRNGKDNSLAARMARRAGEGESNLDDGVESYNGQVLEGKDEDGLDYKRSTNWMATTFKCRQHIDHSAGADGRKADDYEVVDDQKDLDGGSDRKKNHHHHHRKHSKRSNHSKE